MKKSYFFAFLTVRSCPRLIGEYVQKLLQKLTARFGKLKKKIPCARQGKKLPILCKKTSFLSKDLNGKSVLGKNCFPMYFIHFPTSTKIIKKS
jgi:hypothetical protein